MYAAILILLLAAALLVTYSGLKNSSTPLMGLGLGIGVVTVTFFWFMGFWGDFLWFENLGYGDRFIREIVARAGFALAGVVAGLAYMRLLTFRLPPDRTVLIRSAHGLSAVLFGGWAYANWDVILRYWYAVETQASDPILARNTGFYLFRLPAYDSFYGILFLVTLIGAAVSAATLYIRIQGDIVELYSPRKIEERLTRYRGGASFPIAMLLLVLVWGKYLDRFHLMYSQWGAVSGPGWTDVHIRLAAYLVVMVVTFTGAVALLVPPIRSSVESWISRLQVPRIALPAATVGVVCAAVGIVWFAALTVIPGMFQWLRVEPNEITFEEPYIANNIEFTRRGFNLHTVEEREFPVSESFTWDMVNDNRNIFENVRLWDWRALDQVYKQFQEIRLYYEFDDVDVDRYTYDGQYRQVMVSAREMAQENLPENSQTFVNKRFLYTHGYGITLTNVHEFTPEGLPNLLIKDIPPKSTHSELTVDRPEIYYGTLSNSHVVVNSEEEEFDYPSGEQNVYVRYGGSGGVQLSNIWRKFLFGWKFDGTKFFLSGYPTAESRIMFNRNIKERVRKIAPFLTLDNDPYIVLANGRLYWMLDTYTTSRYYPYSESFSTDEILDYTDTASTRIVPRELRQKLGNINYIRNSVKVVVDAYNGSVDLYVFDPDDPIIRVWDRIFPGMFKPRGEMDKALEQHIRYPTDLLLVQGLVYAKYHMTDPTVFYNQEDLWIRATEKYYSQIQAVEPYYLMWEPPGSDTQQFVVILPFTPKNRQVLIGWIAGLCDPPNYGRFVAYKFPKEKRVLGTQQVETKIDQDSFLSGQLSLWDQRGSNVIRGNVLAIPVEETLIYVEPIYLQAETAAYPELRLVVLMHDDQLSYAETFDEALRGLLGEAGTSRQPAPTAEEGVPAQSFSSEIGRASRAFEDYLQYSGEKEFSQAAEALQELQQSLENLRSLSQ